MLELKYILISFFSGVFIKLYDDINDNELFSDYKKNKFLTEVLKGLTIICITGVSIKFPLTLLLMYLGVFVQYLFDKSGPYKDPYEKSLLVSTLMIFLFFDYQKLTSSEIIKSVKKLDWNVCFFVLLAIISSISYSLFESYVATEEVSHVKLYSRLLGVVASPLMLYILPDVLNPVKILIYCMMGYSIVSICVQYYSLQKQKIK